MKYFVTVQITRNSEKTLGIYARDIDDAVTEAIKIASKGYGVRDVKIIEVKEDKGDE